MSIVRKKMNGDDYTILCRTSVEQSTNACDYCGSGGTAVLEKIVDEISSPDNLHISEVVESRLTRDFAAASIRRVVCEQCDQNMAFHDEFTKSMQAAGFEIDE